MNEIVAASIYPFHEGNPIKKEREREGGVEALTVPFFIYIRANAIPITVAVAAASMTHRCDWKLLWYNCDSCFSGATSCSIKRRIYSSSKNCDYQL